MARRISRIEPWQAAKTLAAVYFVLDLLPAVPIGSRIHNLVAARIGGIESSTTESPG